MAFYRIKTGSGLIVSPNVFRGRERKKEIFLREKTFCVERERTMGGNAYTSSCETWPLLCASEQTMAPNAGIHCAQKHCPFSRLLFGCAIVPARRGW